MLEAFAALVGAVSVYLSVREKVWSWPTAIVNVTLYIFVFYQAKLYADMGLQVVYIVLSVYGWYNWLHGGERHAALHVSRTPKSQRLVLPVVVVAMTVLLGTMFDRLTDASLPYLDSALTSASLVAQWMMTRKYLENWLVWIVADVAYVMMFLYKDLFLTAALYAVFLVLAVLGYRGWRRSLIAHARAPAAA